MCACVLRREVNFFGMINVTKAFLPMVKRKKGRIINISSVAGVSSGYHLSSAYAGSKHAVESFTSALRQEMKPWGVKVRSNTPLASALYVALHSTRGLSDSARTPALRSSRSTPASTARR